MSISPSDMQVAAIYFDGRSAAGKAVLLSHCEGGLLLQGDGIDLHWPLDAVRISERMGNTPRLIAHRDGGQCEVTDQAGLATLLAQVQGRNGGWLERLHHSLPWAFAALVLVALCFVLSYRYLLPWGAEVLAMRVPETVLQQMGVSSLETLDKFMLQPSKLDVARQQQLRDAYAGLKPPAETKLHYRIEFRSAPKIGPNAFALPDGTIVMLDELVALTQDDNELLAVLAHERGHVERRHAMRMVLQSSIVGLVLTWYVGDASTLLATAPAIVMQAKYSRDMEREADRYAEQTMHANGLTPCLLGTILGKMEAAYRAKEKERHPQDKVAQDDSVTDYLSSHPATSERMQLMCPGS